MNLTDSNMTFAERKILAKGFSFVPTPNWPTWKIMESDYNTFARRIRLRLMAVAGMFGEYIEEIPKLRKRNPKWDPLESDDYYQCIGAQSVEKYISLTRKKLLRAYKSSTRLKYYHQTIEQNMSKIEYLTLINMKNKGWLIKRADKSASPILLSKDDYNKMIMAHLNNKLNYRELSTESADTHEAKCKELILTILKKAQTNKLKIESSLIKYMQKMTSCKDHKRPIFYGLIKIHKPPNMMIDQPRYPARPVAGVFQYITTGISKYISLTLENKVIKNIPEIINNSTDLIKIIEKYKITDKNTYICTFDVKSMYPNMSTKRTLDSLKKAAENHGKDLTSDELNLIIKLSEIVLNNLIVTFKDKNYLQILGTAMGTNCAPQLANLFGFVLEQDVMNKLKDMIPTLRIHIYVRYIDDIFMLVDSENTAELIRDKLSEVDPKITYTMECSKSSINFMDLKIYKGERYFIKGILDSQTYTKKTSCKLYPIPSSYHNPITVKGWITAEIQRHLRNCSSIDNYQIELLKFLWDLRNRGIFGKYITKIFKAFPYNRREEILWKNLISENKNKKKTIPYIYTCKYDACTKLIPICSILNLYWKILPTKINDDVNIVFKKGKNLRSVLIKSDSW